MVLSRASVARIRLLRSHSRVNTAVADVLILVEFDTSCYPVNGLATHFRNYVIFFPNNN